MKKIIFTIFILLNITANAQDIIYCPTQIICDNNTTASCEFEQTSKQHWSHIKNKANILAGNYYPSYVSASYHSTDPGYAICVYTHENASQTLTLLAKPESNLEMHVSEINFWRSEETWWECKPNPLEACPLQEQETLFISNESSSVLTIQQEDIQIATLFPNQYRRILPNELDCASQNICKISINTNEKSIGNILLDNNHAFSIVSINSENTSFNIEQMISFNAIEITKNVLSDSL